MDELLQCLIIGDSGFSIVYKPGFVVPVEPQVGLESGTSEAHVRRSANFDLPRYQTPLSFYFIMVKKQLV